MSQDDWENVNVLSPSSDGYMEVKEISEHGSRKRTFRVGDYIPDKYGIRNFSRSCYIITGIVIVMLVIVIVSIIWSSNSDKNFQEYNGQLNEPVDLLLSDDKTLWIYDGKNTTVLQQFNSSIGSFDMYGGYVFWSEKNTSRIYFTSENEQLNTTILLEETRIKPQKMAFDYIGDNLYIVDKSAESLIVINIFSKKHDILLTELIRPHDIDLDPDRGLMFILQHSDSILKGNMDGKNLVKIIENRGISAITLDRRNRKIYWVNDIVGIEASDYHGHDLETFRTDALNIVDLAIFKNQLFWLWLDHDNTPIHHLVSCTIDKGSCDNHNMQPIDPVGDFKSIKIAYDFEFHIAAIFRDYREDNGGCEHIVLVIPDGKHTCTCNLGWQLNPDKKTCREVREFMLFTLVNQFRGRILDISRNVSVDAIWPTPYDVKWSDTISFDYDNQNDDLYFTDGISVMSMKLKANWTGQRIILNGSSYVSIKDLTYDWVTGNLYYLSKGTLLYGGGDYRLRMFNVKLGSQYEKIILQSSCDTPYRFSASCSTANLVVHPKRGYLFFLILKSLTDGFIQKATTTGTKLNEIADTIYVINEFKLIALDYEEEQIYWSQNDYPVRIRHANFDFSDVKNITVYAINNTRSMSIYRQWIYLSNHFSVWRFDKLSGETAIRIAPLQEDNVNRRISSVKIVSNRIQNFKGEKPCKTKENGGCKQLCFYEDQKVKCSCRESEVLDSEGYCRSAVEMVHHSKGNHDDEYKEHESDTDHILYDDD